VDHVALATKLFPEQLRRAGLTDVDVPKSWGDMASLDDGVLLWQIEFKEGRRRGFIYTSKDRQLRADFILAFADSQ
jgi:hypothetical protein